MNHFRLISSEQAVALGCAVALVATVLFAVPEPKVAEYKPAMIPCATIRQYAAGEHWSPSILPKQQPVCVGGVLGDLPYVLTSPMQERE